MNQTVGAADATGFDTPARVASRTRIQSIDALRGLVMLLMLVDHAREFFFLHAQVSDPMDVNEVTPALYFSRLAAHLCAPVFVALTGLSAWLYGAQRSRADVSAFLFKRGLFLVVLELTLVNFAWTFALPPEKLYLQVIWVIGLSMIALAALVHLPRLVLAALGAIIVLGHNLLDPIAFAPGDFGYVFWTILHDRGVIDLPLGIAAQTSYPLLPWIGVIALGYSVGPWFAKDRDPNVRAGLLWGTGLALLAAFVVLRVINGYGEPVPWQAGDSGLRTAMSFFNLTKYPPSADFVLFTLGIGTLLLAALERVPAGAARMLAVFGGAPLFFYLLHLYVLHLLNLGALYYAGANEGSLFSVPTMGYVWLIAILLTPPLGLACAWFGRLKRRSPQPWMRYL
ncbi:hypothetical protein C84B14_02146 [Salinisphaera sp. C84B14]|uniref:DUF1624 domain-containing protein n=1 Tax=Salinisphaera sp. C84B14 TaxID=1304155 RepID=UPI003340070E